MRSPGWCGVISEGICYPSTHDIAPGPIRTRRRSARRNVEVVGNANFIITIVWVNDANVNFNTNPNINLPRKITLTGDLAIDGRNFAQMILRMPIIKLHRIGRFAHRYGIIDR